MTLGQVKLPKAVARAIACGSTLTLATVARAATDYDPANLGQLLASFGLIVTLLVVVLGCAWLFLPFAVYGLKPLLRKVLDETSRTNDLLEQIRLASEQRTQSEREHWFLDETQQQADSQPVEQ